jgi:hypothetical protein
MTKKVDPAMCITLVHLSRKSTVPKQLRANDLTQLTYNRRLKVSVQITRPKRCLVEGYKERKNPVSLAS